ncbi:helix-turn-helix domain-containing protein [Pseudoflavonifractor sp.]|jgi:transcriptional regulator with XRE-family HTH domain|uniref:helix-turn-helix domain-containing protein n=1 Tax=Pseudoflavonifractor sp. TaxID=1980281 RepID=UPI003D89BBD8
MLGQRLRILRQSRRKTQSEIAELLNISRSAYALYEAGKRQLNYDSLVILADFYHVSLDYLFDRTDVPELQSSFTLEERRLLSRYRALDSRGRETVQALADAEYSISNRKK